ncbi:Nucleolar Complex 2 protein [Lobosporangium transversale]|uniref:Noc2p family-domain-containing protein n=1 Tax=Lobosporangium transversale TaxID=64571 RepID=A0A1Y2GVQ2_9FUNG|nr:Noc2p family-domain-containing protein [Lobosporangium transversale]KAF9913524.1 Nucleolar Complex 2 protein [Lobosporangium transversale]ORZ23855.1 Noc2p family-domain-containing protein [Lobosporangium transversale]|eukprot:XP_021883669.1 Noc2p family-domain-containing protein [Lobosporangium transversale]
MAKATKATIKFQKKHLKSAIEKRRKKQKATQLYKKRNPKKFGRGTIAEGSAGGSSEGQNRDGGHQDENAESDDNDKEEQENDKTKSMSVDEFFNNGLESDGSDNEEEPESGNEDFTGIDTIIEENDDSDMETPITKKLTADQKAKQAAKEEAARKINLEALKEKDPQFYKYLQENDKELLEFDGEMEDLISEDEDEDDDEEGERNEEMEESDEEMKEAKGKERKGKKEAEIRGDEGEQEDESMDGIPLVTKDMVAAWQTALVEKHSLRALRRLLLAFRAGAHLHDADDQRVYAYRINSPVVFNKLVVTCLKYVIPTLNYHLPIQTTAGGKPKPVNSGSKYIVLQPLIKSFLQNTLFLLKELTDQEMIYFVIRESEKAIRYLVGFPKVAKDLLKHLLFLWSTASDRVRIISFLTIRTMCLQLGSTYLDLGLKGVYLTFVRYAKTTTMHTLPNLHLMQNCVAQLYGLDLGRSYQHGFVYIRQLAIHLRNAVLVKTKESFKAVYNWQYLHCLSLWSQVISTHALNNAGQPTSLHALVFPLVQVSLGALRLIPTSTYYPLRFQIIRNLLQLIENTGTFIPLAPFLFEVLESGEMKRPGRKGTLKPVEWDLGFKCSKDYKGSRVYQDGVGEQVYELMTEYYALFSTSISFPELAIPAIIQLKRFIKKSSLVKLTKQFAGLVDKLEQNSRYVEAERNKGDFSPNDATGVSAFLKYQDKEKTPLGSYWKGVKRSVMAKRKMIEEARKDRVEREDKTTSSSSRTSKDDSDDGDEDEDQSMDEDDLEEVGDEDDYSD